MSDFCAHCGEKIPPDRREQKKYRHKTNELRGEINAALCSACEERVIQEGYEQQNKD
jgi:phage terminase large subunit GpA-like protein